MDKRPSAFVEDTLAMNKRPSAFVEDTLAMNKRHSAWVEDHFLEKKDYLLKLQHIYEWKKPTD
ncbi:hypothetical protein [Labilibaculum sp.]|uniref:hypothetical protein n=1 Tax=Labilibaculum sp. TaxID=2060723 RepID=UPI002AA77FDA|nr:hypothetical protein [Labilibaculum sp.]MBN2598267.1 hypothetical protein [Marinifilaceae bacterium]